MPSRHRSIATAHREPWTPAYAPGQVRRSTFDPDPAPGHARPLVIPGLEKRPPHAPWTQAQEATNEHCRPAIAWNAASMLRQWR